MTIKKTASQLADYVIEKIAFSHPLTESGDFRDATPEEWKEHQTERSATMVKQLGTAAGIPSGVALGVLLAAVLSKNKGALIGGGLLGGTLGGVGGRAVFGNMNKKEVEGISSKEWEKGLNQYNEQWARKNT